MAVTTTYFAPAAQGSGDGSSAANAAALFSGGAFPNAIKALDFTTNAHRSIILAGTYTGISTGLAQSGTPTLANPWIIAFADASGNILAPTRSLGGSGPINVSGGPDITLNAGVKLFATVPPAWTRCVGVGKLTGSTSEAGSAVLNIDATDCGVCGWTVQQNGSGTGIATILLGTRGTVRACDAIQTGASYDAIILSTQNAVFVTASRVWNSGVNTSGDQAAIDISGNNPVITGNIVFGHGGAGILAASNTAGSVYLRNTIYGGMSGINLSGAARTTMVQIDGNILLGTAVALSAGVTSVTLGAMEFGSNAMGNWAAANVSGNDNWPTGTIIAIAATDLVDPANGDFRPKPTWTGYRAGLNGGHVGAVQWANIFGGSLGRV